MSGLRSAWATQKVETMLPRKILINVLVLCLGISARNLTQVHAAPPDNSRKLSWFILKDKTKGRYVLHDQATALTACQAKNGRLPTLKELTPLIAKCKKNNEPWITCMRWPIELTETPAAIWTATPHPKVDHLAYYLSTSSSYLYVDETKQGPQLFVACVASSNAPKTK